MVREPEAEHERAGLRIFDSYRFGMAHGEIKERRDE